jgi:cell fate (sporulation/competence/biofilm development) regulator YlbF (YheA/YmcA/DUF963 family)
MDATEEILDLARRLGQALARHERFARLRDAEAAVRKDADAPQLSHELNEQMIKIARLEDQMKPIEPADKHLLQELRDKVYSNAALQDLARANADYMEIMSQVNNIIQKELAGKADAEEKPQAT